METFNGDIWETNLDNGDRKYIWETNLDNGDWRYIGETNLDNGDWRYIILKWRLEK